MVPPTHCDLPEANLDSKVNQHYHLTTNVADNGYAGLKIMPRWASNIYYNASQPPPPTATDR